MRRLEEQIRQSSCSSSTPPSAGPPKTRQERRAEARAKAKELLRADRKRRKAGGQSGHRGLGRKLGPEDQIDEIVDHYPERCGGCGHHFSDHERQPSRRFGRHQVAELPPIAVVVSEHRTHRLRCPDCRAKATAELPGELFGSAFGRRLRAAVVTLSARNRISRRDMAELAGGSVRAGDVGGDGRCDLPACLAVACRAARAPGCLGARLAGAQRRLRPAGGRRARGARCGARRRPRRRSSGSRRTATATASPS